MKTLGMKLIGGYFLLLLMLCIVALYASFASQRSLQDSIGRNSSFLASEMLVNMNMAIYDWVDRVEQRIQTIRVKSELEASNRAFDGMGDPSSYMDQMDLVWAASSKAEPTPPVQRLFGTDLSREMRSQFIERFEKKRGEGVIISFIVTNKYGALAAAAATVRRFRFDKDEIWRAAKESGSTVGQVEVDEESGQSFIPLAVPVSDTQGNFAGEILVKVLSTSLIRDAVITYKKYENTQVRLATTDGRLIYSTRPFHFMEDISTKAYFRNIKEDSGSFVADESGRGILFSFARSHGYLSFAGLPWILIVGNDVNEVLAPSFALRNSIILASGVLLVLGILAALLISRSITRPVALLTKAAAEIARGNLGHEIRLRGNDELGMLAQSFVQMKVALQGIAAMAERIAAGDLAGSFVPRSESDSLGIALKVMVENLQGQLRGIQEGAAVVVTAASEISASTSQFAANSSETSVAVSQTTATIEEVKQTAHLSNEKAKLVAEKAKSNEEVAQAGRDSVRVTTQLINGFREQMEAIGESITRLSEQSMAIGEITATVSDLADQSNLLSVNAAIEAVKAGEQGKGFGVVAQEIKGLAEQSKRATAQVRKILSDIQKATAGAVMATEKGSKSLEQGMKQSEEARESIEMLAETVEEAVQAAAQIAASSQQQLVGMDQVATAMESIKVASLQGVAGTKQLEGGAQNLHAVGQKLKLLAEFYKV